MQLKKNEQKSTDDVVNKTDRQFEAREENEGSQCHVEAGNMGSKIDDFSQNIKSNMTIADGVTVVESERNPQESGVNLDTLISLPEVVVLEQQFYFTALFLPCC